MHQARVFTVTHPFHPLSGQTLEVLVVKNLWGADRVCYAGPEGRSRSVPVEWTDLAGVDPFVVLARGRAPFRLVDLLALRSLLSQVQEEGGEGDPS